MSSTPGGDPRWPQHPTTSDPQAPAYDAFPTAAGYSDQPQGPLPGYPAPGAPGYALPGYATPAYPTGPGGYRLAPPDADTNSPWAWIVSLLPVLSLGALFFSPAPRIIELYDRYVSGAINESTLLSQLISELTGTIGLLSLLGLVLYAAAVVSASMDYRHLVAVGIDRPFHWAWAFLLPPLVYGIGRAVVLNSRRARGWAGPLWALIATAVVVWIGSGIVSFMMFADFLPLIEKIQQLR